MFAKVVHSIANFANQPGYSLRTVTGHFASVMSLFYLSLSLKGYNSHVAGNAIVNLLAKLSTMKRFYELNLSRLKLGKPRC
ncbi:hypothetical protein K1719_043898 [Acacia pycnantha]|nr:hypothetical protein K1719_043898 [Acacia pycnantha]